MMKMMECTSGKVCNTTLMRKFTTPVGVVDRTEGSTRKCKVDQYITVQWLGLGVHLYRIWPHFRSFSCFPKYASG